MNSISRNLLVGLGRVAAKAGVKAIDSVLEDVQSVLNEGQSRIAKARSRARKIEQEEEEED
jgi:hypothetical protein